MKKVTIKDVAAKANVAISAVSYIMNNSEAKKYSADTIERVKKAAEELNYVPNNLARGVRNGKCLSIGIVSFWDIHNRVFIELLEGIMQKTFEMGYSAILCKADDDFTYIDYYRNRRIDGVIFISPVPSEYIIDESEHIEKMKQAQVPFIVINGSTEYKDTSYFYFDFENITYTATNYLIDRGHREIAYVGSYVNSEQAESILRYSGYKKAMTEKGLSYTEYHVEDITPEMLKKMKAIVANKSETAKIIEEYALKNEISIPKDLSVIACNLEHYSEFLCPPLTCCHIQLKETGALAAEFLINNLDGKKTISVFTECGITEGKSVIDGKELCILS